MFQQKVEQLEAKGPRVGMLGHTVGPYCTTGVTLANC